MGASSNPFSRGVMIFDKRDLLKKTVDRQKAAEAYFKRQMKVVAGAEKALREQGYLYAIRPMHLKSVVSRDDLGEGDYFYVNYSPRGRSQVFGWFTVEELFEYERRGTTWREVHA